MRRCVSPSLWKEAVVSEECKFDFRVRSAQEFYELVGGETEFATLQMFGSKAEWLEGRKGHIGASDAWKILNTESRRELFEEMAGRRKHEDLSGVEIVQRGVYAEPHVRALIAIENPDWDVYDGSNLLFVSKRKPFMSASLDCIGVHRKTGEVCDWELKEAPWSNKWKGDFAPDGYFAQIMHQSYVTGIDLCALHPRIYLRRDGAFMTAFERSYEFDMTAPEVASQVKELVDEEQKFWDEFKRGEYKPRLNLASIF